MQSSPTLGQGRPAESICGAFGSLLLPRRNCKTCRASAYHGEDLVAFRDKSGAVGLLELHCPHRGTSLEFGLVSEKGIRCCYHGWRFDVDGKILEGEPPDSTLKDRLYHGAYPVHEYCGLVFAYMGPPDQQPAFPILDTFHLPGYQLVARPGYIWPCNWLQVKENSMDPAHLAFLHTLPGSEGFTGDLAALGEWDFMETTAGMVLSTRGGKGIKSGYAWPTLFPRISTSSRQIPTRWHSAPPSIGRWPPHGRSPSTIPT